MTPLATSRQTVRGRAATWIAAALVLSGCAGIAALENPVARLPAMLAGTAVASAGWALAWRRAAPGRAVALGVAVAARILLLLPATPLSDDLYRYLWEGRVGNAGLDPYRHAPEDVALRALRDDEVWPRVNHPAIPTIYPPLAQLSFRALDAIAPFPRAPRVAAAALDIATMLLLATLLRRRGRSPALAVAYGWCPLAILETAGGGHVDVLGSALLVLALLAWTRRSTRRAAITTGALWSASLLVKPAAVVLAPWLIAGRFPGRRWLLVGAVAGLVLTVPYLGAGAHAFTGLRAYAEHWQFNDALYSLLVVGGMSPHRARALLAVTLAGFCVVAGRRLPDAGAAVGVALGAALVLSPTVHPWYGLWLVPWLPFLPDAIRPAGFTLCALLPLSYVTPWRELTTGVWDEPTWPRAVQWGGTAAILAATIVRRRIGRAAVPAATATDAAGTSRAAAG